MDLKGMTDFLYNGIRNGIPRESDAEKLKKHKNKPKHIQDIAINQPVAIPLGTTGGYVFEIGNDFAETNYPYYHILEDAQVIHKAGKGTRKSKGSQASFLPSERDYGKWSGNINKKNYIAYNEQNGEVYGTYQTTSRSVYQEYRKNVRGSRSKIVNGQTKNSTTYVNRHYHYIEKTLDSGLLDLFATQFGLKRKRNEVDMSEEIKEAFGEN